MDCYAFLKPDAEMLDKYIRSLDEARNADVIDEKTFLFLRTHKVVLDSLMDITKGDYARFNSNTYLEVYEDIQEKTQKKDPLMAVKNDDYLFPVYKNHRHLSWAIPVLNPSKNPLL